MKALIYSPQEWQIIFDKIKKDKPPSVWMIRDNMKKKMGFTVRSHSVWIDGPKTVGDDLNYGYSELQIHLDFYDEKFRTMFLLKYEN